jgi:hypothetical protein
MSRDTALVTTDWLEPRSGQPGILVIEVGEDDGSWVEHGSLIGVPIEV